jgi:hypothetical protein
MCIYLKNLVMRGEGNLTKYQQEGFTRMGPFQGQNCINKELVKSTMHAVSFYVARTVIDVLCDVCGSQLYFRPLHHQ